MRRGAELLAVARLDLAEVVRSRWLAACLVVYLLLALVFVLVGLRESAVLEFTGMGRVLFSLSQVLVLFLPLLALVVSGQVVGRAREEGALELLLSQPLRRSSYLLAIAGVRFAALAVPLLGLLLVLGLAGRLAFGEEIAWRLVGRCAGVSGALLFAFCGLGIAISCRVESPARAMTYLILAWAAGVALLDFALIGAMLRWQLQPHAVFLLAAANPVQAARMALLAAAEPELATLGPVGFYLAHRVGRSALLGLGLAWPLAFGGLTLGLALRHFQRADVA